MGHKQYCLDEGRMQLASIVFGGGKKELRTGRWNRLRTVREKLSKRVYREAKDIQIISKVAGVELYNKVVQNNLFIFRHADCFFPQSNFSKPTTESWKTSAMSAPQMEIIYSSAFVSGKNHLTVYSARERIVGVAHRT